MLENASAIDLIERAHDARPFCGCGRPTTTVWRDGIVWLECSWLTEGGEGRVWRVVKALGAHLHERILDLRQTPVQSPGPQ